MLSSSRNAATLLERFCEVKYAMMDLCLSQVLVFQRAPNSWGECSQLLGLPRRQNLAHGSDRKRCIRLWVVAKSNPVRCGDVRLGGYEIFGDAFWRRQK